MKSFNPVHLGATGVISLCRCLWVGRGVVLVSGCSVSGRSGYWVAWEMSCSLCWGLDGCSDDVWSDAEGLMWNDGVELMSVERFSRPGCFEGRYRVRQW